MYVVYLPTEYVMTTWAPGSHGDDWTWRDEIADLRSRGELHALSEEIMRNGFDPLSPVLLGGDGRVWDGHHRIIAAYMKGVKNVSVEFGFVRDQVPIHG